MKSSEIKGDGQEMATVMLIPVNFNNACRSLLKLTGMSIIAAISWLPPLISELFTQAIQGHTIFLQFSCFVLV